MRSNARYPPAPRPRFRTRLAEYVKRLSGGRGTERRNKLRLAEERLERKHAEGSNPMLAAISKGSLRALSIERVGTEIVIHAEADAGFDALSLGLTQHFQAPSRRVLSLRSTAWGAALLCCGALVGLGARFAVAEPAAGRGVARSRDREPGSERHAFAPSAARAGTAERADHRAARRELARIRHLHRRWPPPPLQFPPRQPSPPRRNESHAPVLRAAVPAQTSAPISAFGPRL